MRITVEITSDQNIILPIQYNHILQAFIYDHLSDKDYRRFLHQEGYQLQNKHFKFFTFSRLLGKFDICPREQKIVFIPPVKLIVSAAVEQFITDLAETLIRSDNCLLGSNTVFIKSIDVHKGFEPIERIRIKMLSPMVAYTTAIKDNKKQTHYYSPWRHEFVDIARCNLMSKYKVLYGETPSNHDFAVIPTGNQERKCRHIVNYKGTVIEAYAGIYWLRGNPELIRVAYETGLGSKNSQGFGCWEEIRGGLDGKN